jgi:hypothetical protein
MGGVNTGNTWASQHRLHMGRSIQATHRQGQYRLHMGRVNTGYIWAGRYRLHIGRVNTGYTWAGSIQGKYGQGQYVQATHGQGQYRVNMDRANIQWQI